MQKTKAQIKWESDHDIVEQLEIIKSWTDYEDAGVERHFSVSRSTGRNNDIIYNHSK